jgi:hypothetical protein
MKGGVCKTTVPGTSDSDSRSPIPIQRKDAHTLASYTAPTSQHRLNIVDFNVGVCELQEANQNSMWGMWVMRTRADSPGNPSVAYSCNADLSGAGRYLSVSTLKYNHMII